MFQLCHRCKASLQIFLYLVSSSVEEKEERVKEIKECCALWLGKIGEIFKWILSLEYYTMIEKGSVTNKNILMRLSPLGTPRIVIPVLVDTIVNSQSSSS